MTTYIALLRGVNVGGNTLKMDRLREMCGELGFENVRTYLQSGNVLFEAGESPSKVLQMLEKKLVGQTRLPISVIVRTSADLGSVIARNPFLKDKAIDIAKLHVTFLQGAATNEAAMKLSAIPAARDAFFVAGKEIYLHCPDGYGNTKLSNNVIQKVLGVTATTRNWNTVNHLYGII